MSSKKNPNLSGKSLSSLVQSLLDKKINKKSQIKRNGPSQVDTNMRQLLNNRSFNRTYLRSKAGSANSFCLEGREVLSEVYTSRDYVKQVDQPINPANPLLFPRLAAIAQAFEQYHFVKLRFLYVTGTAATTVGSVLHYIDYDVIDGDAPSALQLLANETAVISSIALDSAVAYDVNNQMLSKLYTNSNIGMLTSDAGAERQDYCGRYRLFTDKGSPSANVFGGYVYVEYEVEFFTPIPPEPLSECAINDGTFTMAPNGQIFPAFNDIKTAEGLQPGQAGDADPSTYGGATCGGIVGALDAAKTVYQAGEYLYGLYANFGAASASQKTTSYVRRKPKQKDTVDDLEIKEDWVDEARQAKKSSNLGLVANDIQVNIGVYDVTNGVINSDFPIDASGMTHVMDVTSVINTAGVKKTGAILPLTVPLGKRYMCQGSITLGPTTGRSVTSPTVTVNALSTE